MKPDTIDYPGQTEFRAYIKVFCSLSAVVLVSIAGLNYFVDPYLIHQWKSSLVQRLRPTEERLSPWGKTYAVAAYKPSILYLGNSRTEFGLPTDSPVFSGKKVFSGAISGATVTDAITMGKHASSVSQLDTVVWGIDYQTFSDVVGNTEFDRELVSDSGNYFFYRVVLDIKRVFAVDMIRDSIRTLLGMFDPVCRSSLAFNGQRDHACMEKILEKRGIQRAVEEDAKTFAKTTPSAEKAFYEFNSFIRELCSRKIRVRLYINPTHALTMSALYWDNKWDLMEAWLRQLVEIADAARYSGCDIRLFNFSGFNSITTESVPQVSGKSRMENYAETSHYRDNVGMMILEKMFDSGTGSVPDDFGEELNKEMLSAYLEKMRFDRDQYHVAHPVETQLVKSLVSNQR